jgi:hypothetical protein
MKIFFANCCRLFELRSVKTMSEKWETVGKAKPVMKGGKSVATNGSGTGPKKVIRPLPKLEDVLPKNSLIDNVYSAAFDLPPSPKASPKKEKKEPAKKAAPAKKEEKPRVPTTLQEAVKVTSLSYRYRIL